MNKETECMGCTGKVSMGENESTGQIQLFHSVPCCKWYYATPSEDIITFIRMRVSCPLN